MSISTATRDELCCEIINQYLFDKVWNEPVSEYRINVHPSLVTKYSKVGTFHVADANVYLPSTNEPYFVWYMKSTDINLGLKLDTAVWYDTALLSKRLTADPEVSGGYLSLSKGPVCACCLLSSVSPAEEERVPEAVFPVHLCRSFRPGYFGSHGRKPRILLPEQSRSFLPK